MPAAWNRDQTNADANTHSVTDRHANGGLADIASPAAPADSRPWRPCPVEQEHAVSPDFSPALGGGPVYPVGPWVHSTYAIDGARNDQGWYYLKVLWVARPEYTGLILIRGRQIDGPNALLFGSSLTGQDLLTELELPAGSGGPYLHGWGNWPSYTMPRAPGCYAYQVDGLSFSEVIVFQVVP